MRVGEHQVVVDRAGEQHGLLRHHAEVLPQLVGREMADVVAVDLDLALGGQIEALQQLGERALAAARRAHQGHALRRASSLRFEVLVQVRQVLGVAETQVLDLDPRCLRWRFARRMQRSTARPARS